MPLIVSPPFEMLAVLAFSFSLTLAESALTSVIVTNNGPVRGEILTTVIKSMEYSSFKGIPYAKPPIGYLRFKPPIEADSWTRILLATEQRSSCPQMDFIYLTLTGNEDCLYLNVYTPKIEFNESDTNLRPVMVWIYGGSFKNGYSNSSVYGPDFIVEEGVVLVTFNYRLGALGFLSLNHPNATGNAGLKDQNLVLKWIRDNIAKFGGNPESVTIFGQSAGGAAAEYHMLSDMSRGLFHRTISMSASILNPWAFQVPAVALKHAFLLGAILGSTATTKEELLQTLYETSAYDLILATNKMTLLFYPPFKPTLENPAMTPKDKIFLSKCSLIKIISGNFSQVPHMMGFTANETVRFIPSGILELIRSAVSSLRSLPRRLFRKSESTFPISTFTLSATSNSTITNVLDKIADIFFIAGIDAKQRFLHVYNSQPVYYYRVSFDTEYSLHRLLYNIDFNGTAHGDDLAYLFHTSLIDIPFKSNVLLSITRQRMVRMWTNFAKYGNPTPYGTEDPLLNIVWPDSGPLGRHLEIGKDLSIGNRPISPRVYLYELGTKISSLAQYGCVFPFLLT